MQRIYNGIPDSKKKEMLDMLIDCKNPNLISQKMTLVQTIDFGNTPSYYYTIYLKI